MLNILLFIWIFSVNRRDSIVSVEKFVYFICPINSLHTKLFYRHFSIYRRYRYWYYLRTLHMSKMMIIHTLYFNKGNGTLREIK